MDDNEKINALVSSLVSELNFFDLPITVKELALENILLRIRVAKQDIQKGENVDA